MRNWQLSVEELPDPVPGPGQALTRVLACGICGSDLHMLLHGEEQLRLGAELAQGQPVSEPRMIPFTGSEPVVMGHEFCCEVVEPGPGFLLDALRLLGLRLGPSSVEDGERQSDADRARGPRAAVGLVARQAHVAAGRDRRQQPRARRDHCVILRLETRGGDPQLPPARQGGRARIVLAPSAGRHGDQRIREADSLAQRQAHQTF